MTVCRRCTVVQDFRICWYEMLTATAVFRLTLLVGLACAEDQHALPGTGRLDRKPRSPAGHADKQVCTSGENETQKHAGLCALHLQHAARGREKRDIPEKNPPTSGVARHDSHMTKSGSGPSRVSNPVRLDVRSGTIESIRVTTEHASCVQELHHHSNTAKEMDEMIYQSAMAFPDWPLEGDIILNTRLSEDNDTELDQHSTEQETSISKPVQHLPDMFDTFKPQYKLVDSLGYYKVVKGRHLSWEEARAACRAEGAHLAVVNSKREAAALSDLYYKEGIKTDLVIHTVWIGAYRPRGQHQFITVHGTQLKKVGFNAWKNEKHNKDTNERCVLLDVDMDAKLTSSSCNLGQHHICEHQLHVVPACTFRHESPRNRHANTPRRRLYCLTEPPLTPAMVTLVSKCTTGEQPPFYQHPIAKIRDDSATSAL
ncbi:hypothetical protein PR048_027922 [Dryococelus australis]|uniref:C-type lectin domain-containing protein n=1 Tax=Dryococelus australis TaxID=614101 RepID=A0ABQ9GHS7_9NEOP|nr:hypothetical protein PR048_027922 [Dryococelus australis]